ncbi:MAG: thioredoxin domain-containing protein, partial [Deltaproteobacteria bacterium]|nr:thioredoxin domain-containing protein [Deltaproteobacteria bacterium]
KKQNELFWDEKEAAYFFSDGQDPSVLLRTKEGSDGALPNSNAVSTLNLLRLFHLGAELEMKERADQTLQVFSSGIKNYPHAFAQFLIAFDFFNSKTSEIAVIEEKANPSSSDFLKKIRKIFIPSKVIAVGQAQSSSPPLLNGKKEIASQTTFYLCQNQHCEKPTTDFEEVLNLLQEK